MDGSHLLAFALGATIVWLIMVLAARGSYDRGYEDGYHDGHRHGYMRSDAITTTKIFNPSDAQKGAHLAIILEQMNGRRNG